MFYLFQANKNYPVQWYQKYVSNLYPDCDELWQRRKESFAFNGDVWYRTSSEKNLCQIIWRKRQNLKISLICTKTILCVLPVLVIDGCECVWSSHNKSVLSIKSYSHFISDRKKREISDTLSSALWQKNQPDVPSKQCNLSDIHNVFVYEFDFADTKWTL